MMNASLTASVTWFAASTCFSRQRVIGEAGGADYDLVEQFIGSTEV